MSTWGTVALASVPAAITAGFAYVGGRPAGAVEGRRNKGELEAQREQRRSELHMATLERMYGPIQEAYIHLVVAERELRFQSPHFSIKDYQRWNDETFRPAVAAVYVLGAPAVRTTMD